MWKKKDMEAKMHWNGIFKVVKEKQTETCKYSLRTLHPETITFQN